MANEIVFAIEHVLTSEGWFLPGHLLPKHDLDDAEGMKLLEERKIGVCAYDSPLAKAVHDSRAMDPYASSQYLKRVIEVDQLSPNSPPAPGEQDEPDDDWVDPTPVGEFPTLENYLRAGYRVENYEGQKTGFYEDKKRESDEKAAAQMKTVEDAALAKDKADKEADAIEAAEKAASSTAEAKGEEPKGEEPKGDEPKGDPASEPNSGAPTE